MVLGLCLLGCGGSVEQNDGNGGSAGAGGSGALAGSGGTGGSGAFGGSPPGGGPGTGGTGAMGGGGMGGGSMGGSGGAIACGVIHETLNVKIISDWGGVPECMFGGVESQLWQTTGAVLKTDASAFVIDTCPPDADCMPSLTSVFIDASGLSLAIPIGAFVKVTLELSPTWGGCSTRISVRNVPFWGGASNPALPGNHFLFLGTDGELAHPEAPFSVSKLPLGCAVGGQSCGEPADDFALSFGTATGEPAVVVGMGQTVLLGKLSPQPMWVHNLRSYVSGACDDYWNWAWWASAAYLK
jgi:hypothetical protein